MSTMLSNRATMVLLAFFLNQDTSNGAAKRIVATRNISDGYSEIVSHSLKGLAVVKECMLNIYLRCKGNDAIYAKNDTNESVLK